MDSTSPEREKIATSTSSSPVVKDSPFFNYISNLSPLNEVKPSQVRQGFLEYNVPLPPSVFTSPRINPQPERSFLMRSKHLISSNAQLPLELDNRVNVGISNSEFFGVPVTQSMLGLAPCSLRGCNIKHTGQTQTCSHSGCVDDYLSDSMGTDCVNSAKLKSTKQGCDAAQVSESGCIRSNKTIATRQDTKNKMTTQVAVSEQSNKEDPLGKSFLHGEGPPDEHIIGNSTEVTDLVLSKRFIESSVAAQHCHHLVGHVATDSSIMINEKDNKTSGFNNKISMCSEIGQHRLDDGQLHMADNVQRKELDCNPQILSRSLHIVPACDNLDENSKSSINGVTENRMTNDSEEGGQNQRGTLRRCLQFAEANRSTGRRCFGSWDPTNITLSSHLPENPSYANILESSYLESSAISSNSQAVILSEPPTSQVPLCMVKSPEVHADKVDRSLRNNGNSLTTAPRPSGIGLHLNSIVNPTTMSSNATPRMKFTGKKISCAQRDTSAVEHHLFVKSSSSSLPTNFGVTFEVENNDYYQESQAIVMESPANFSSPQENADGLEENQLSPKNKRKKTSNIMENEGCKRCNCKRSKCLKLYCECFAAGIYCAEPCACQECFNKPEYKDMVLATRQQIESRNPLAFAPKIVRRVIESPADKVEEVSRMTPSSARHKRGCNCKKSMCLKKYCECFQSGVGCSDGCRCEGCKNTFGVKEVYREVAEMVYKRTESESREDQSYAKLDMMEERSSFIHPEKCHPHHLSPLTPSFQRSSHGKDVPKSRVPARRYLPSPESDPNLLSNMRSSKSLRHLNSPERRTTGDESKELIYYRDMELDQFSPKWDRLSDICDLTPTPHRPSKVTNSSSSSNTRENSKVSRVQMSCGSGSHSPLGSLLWRSSPIPPMPRLGGTKLQKDPDSEAMYEGLEDDTPEILKESFTPIKSVKASSPNQKRISPPHNHLHDLRSNSSPGLKSGRKFVLQSISSFPSLTPYSDPKFSSSSK